MKLRGNCPAKVDEKGRLKIPAVFLDELKEYGNQFYITSTTGETARIYPMKVWSEIEDKLAQTPSTNRAKRKFLMRTSYYGQTVELDGQGRLLLPTVLREAAQTKGDVDILGNLDYLEVMNHTRVLDQLKNEPYTDEDDKALADLGVSSMQLDQAARGFSFREAAPLDMRMDAANDELTADEIVNRWSEKEIADLLYREADEHDSRRIAKAIVRARPLRDTAHLATTVAGARKQWGRQRLHPATKTFLALRIAVNREMEELGQFLSRAPATMNSGGRWVVLSYHSREDRLVKRAVREGEREGTLQVLTKHVIHSSEQSTIGNPCSLSANLRCPYIV